MPKIPFIFSSLVSLFPYMDSDESKTPADESATEPTKEKEQVRTRPKPDQILKRWDRLCSALAQDSLLDDDPEWPGGISAMRKRIAKSIKLHRHPKPTHARARKRPRRS